VIDDGLITIKDGACSEKDTPIEIASRVGAKEKRGIPGRGIPRILFSQV
jgi:hypothetical protein